MSEGDNTARFISDLSELLTNHDATIRVSWNKLRFDLLLSGDYLIFPEDIMTSNLTVDHIEQIGNSKEDNDE